MAKRKHSITFTEPTLTNQADKEHVDINNVMARYVRTGVLDHVAKYKGQYTENRETDYHTAMNIVTRANEMFLDLPSQVREKFGNDPHEFLNFVENPDNHDQLEEMGLTNPAPHFINPSTEASPPPSPTPSVQTTETQSEPAPASTATPE